MSYPAIDETVSDKELILRHIHSMLEVICNRFQITDALVSVTKSNMEFVKSLALKVDNLENDIVQQLRSQLIQDLTENERLRLKIKKLALENQKLRKESLQKFESAKKLDAPEDEQIFFAMGTRAANCLRSEGVQTKRDVFEYLRTTPKHEILKTPNIGLKTYNEIIQAAVLHGFKEYIEEKQAA